MWLTVVGKSIWYSAVRDEDILEIISDFDFRITTRDTRAALRTHNLKPGLSEGSKVSEP